MATKNVKLGTKLAGAFTLMIAIAGVLGGVGWWSLTRVQRTQEAAHGVDEATSSMEQARAYERDFVIQGYAKDAEGKTSDDRWAAAYQSLAAQLENLSHSSLYTTEQQEGLAAAAKAAGDYKQAFDSLAGSRKAKDEAFAGWAEIGWKITGQVGTAMEKTIGPAQADARASGDPNGIARWDAIALTLNQDVIQNFLLMRVLGVYLMVTNSDETWQKYGDQYTKTKQALAQWTTLVAGEADLESAGKQLGEFLDQHKGYGQKYYEAIVAARTADKNLTATAKNVVSKCKQIDEQQAAALGSVMGQSKTFTTAVALTGFIVGAFMAVALTRSITKPINRIVNALSDGARQVNEASNQVASASQQLAAGASEQASSLEETSASLEEMAAMTRTNAESARQASELSNQARQAAQSGDQVMGRLNTTMTGINEASGQISKIIKVIEEIAFQTNLLALNAAVEAARAGEHGKGFAVVAEEVRNLAQRAAQAARETTTLIESSVQRAKDGSAVATEVTSALGAIVTNVGKVTDLIDGIAKATLEQAQGVEQVNVAVGQMDKVTQQNAASAEESAAAAEELSAQAVAVDGIVADLASLVHGSADQLRATERRPAPAAAVPSRPAAAARTTAAAPTATDASGIPSDF